MIASPEVVQRSPWWEPVLSPTERSEEVLFGLIMALSITGSLSVAGVGEGSVRGMLIGAIGCNTAWGIVDAAMYLLTTLGDRFRARSQLVAMRQESDPERAREIIAGYIPALLAESIRTPELEHVRKQLLTRNELPETGLTGRDLLAAGGIFMLVFCSTLPVVVPFLLPLEPRVALRVSNGVAIAMLFGVGLGVGKYVGYRPLLVGCCSVAVGTVLVALTIALGG